jgi:cell division protein FtsW
VGCLLLVSLFVLLTLRGLRIASRAPDSFGRLLVLGVTCWISFQALINMAVVTGTIPFTGIALPFISVGGSSLTTILVGVGIMLSVSRAANTVGVPIYEARGIGRWYRGARVSRPDSRQSSA